MHASAFLLIAALLPQADAKGFCWPSGNWLTESADLFGSGHWRVTVCQNGAFETSSTSSGRTTGMLSSDLKATLRDEVDTLPREFTGYVYGAQEVDSYMLSLDVWGGSTRRTYDVGNRLADGCNGHCSTALKTATRLLAFLPPDDYRAALMPWLSEKH